MTRSLVPLLLILGSLAAGCGRERAPVDIRPDVVLVIIDTARADHFGVYGHAAATSPRFDQLAASSVRFEHAYAHSGWTLASIATLYTGAYPSQHRAVRDALTERRFGRLTEATPTLATLYGQQGYATGAFVNNTFLAPEFGMHLGFEHYDYRGADTVDHRSATDTVEQALAWMAELPSTRPAFVVVHMQEPHTNYAPPASTRGTFTGPGDPPVEVPFASYDTLHAYMNRLWVPDDDQKRYIGQLYDEEILAADQALGQLLDGLGQRERDRWTVVTADHGEELWDHGGFEHGHTLAGELTRIPLVVQAPGWEPAVVTTPVQHVDVFRTLADLSGSGPPPRTHGESLAAVIRGEVPARPVLQEDCMHGVSKAAVLDGGYRFEVELATSDVALWTLDEHGQGGVFVEDAAVREAEGYRLYALLNELRGGLQPHRVDAVDFELSEGAREQLQALGYIDR
jgi:arylsulfatase A-like enzyme